MTRRITIRPTQPEPELPQDPNPAILILGAGWLFQFLQPLLENARVKYAATTTDGRNGSIRFRFGYPSSETGGLNHDEESAGNEADGGGGERGDKGGENQFEALPSANIVLVTFPVQGGDAMKFLVRRYLETHESAGERFGGMQGKGNVEGEGGKTPVRWILLGSTGIWSSPGSRRVAAKTGGTETGGSASMLLDTTVSARITSNSPATTISATETSSPTANTSTDTNVTPTTTSPSAPTKSFHYTTPSSPITNPSPRYHAEQTLLSLPTTQPHLNIEATVLNLAGLHGEPHRTKRIFELAVPRTKEGVRGKGSVHFVNGLDVAVLILKICVDLGGEKEGGEEGGDGVGDRFGDRIGDGKGNEHKIMTAHVSDKKAKTGAWENLKGKRWIVSDCRVYDWWDIIWENAGHLEALLHQSDTTAPVRGSVTSPGKTGTLTSSPEMPATGWTYRKWILDLMLERDVQSLPRPVEVLGRALDGRDVWREAGAVPVGGRFGYPV